MKKKHLAIMMILVVILLVIGELNPAGALPVHQEGNLLNNASFEQPFVNGAADGWSTWHQETEKTDDQCLSGYHYVPKWNLETNSINVLDGIASQYIGNNWDTWGGGVYQTVDVTPGTTYRFSFFAKGRTSNETAPSPSDSGINMNIRAAIDPNGGTQWDDADVVWGTASSPHDNWQQFSVEATATGDKMTLFTSADLGVVDVNQCRQFLDTWYDKAELIPVAGTELPAAADSAASSATICVNAFHDTNANGIHDPNERYMTDVTITVANQNAIVGSVISDGTESPKCFQNLEPGTYQVAQQVPPQLQMTSAANVAVEAAADVTVNVAFGSRVRGEPIAEASPGESATGGSQAEGPTGPTSGGMICVNAFHDENANAIIDPNEGYMAGVTLTLASDGEVVGEVVSTGSGTPQCFDNLVPGQYEISQKVSGPLELTTADRIVLAIAEGQALQVDFGSRLSTADSGSTPPTADQGASNAQAGEGANDEGPDLLAIGGLAAIILGVVLLGALIFYLLRR